MESKTGLSVAIFTNLTIIPSSAQLSAYAIRAVPTHWKDFIPSFYQDLRSRVNQTVDGVFLSQQAMELALLDFLTIIAEELGRAEIEPGKR